MPRPSKVKLTRIANLRKGIKANKSQEKPSETNFHGLQVPPERPGHFTDAVSDQLPTEGKTKIPRKVRVERERPVYKLERLKLLESEREEREKEKAREVEKRKKAQTEKEKLMGALYQIFASTLQHYPLTYLQGTDAQTVADFLNNVLYHRDILQPDERKRALNFLCSIVVSAQVVPKAIGLSSVECDLRQSDNAKGYGKIYKGCFQGEAVRVKGIRMRHVGLEKQSLRGHAVELVLGSHVLHPNLLPIYGAFISREEIPRLCIVSPWMDCGCLVDHLHNHPNTPRLPLISDILSGLQHLHEMAIVHAGLKGSNVLISKAQRAVLADFSASWIEMTWAGTTTREGSASMVNWMAPELLTANKPMLVTRESDIWAFGCICYEVLTGRIPFEGYKPAQLIHAFLTGDIISLQLDPSISIEYANEIWALAEMCLRCDPRKRLTAGEGRGFILALKVTDQQPLMPVAPLPPQSLDFSMGIDYDNLVFIIQRVQQNRSNVTLSGSELSSSQAHISL